MTDEVKCPSFFGLRRCPIDRLKKLGLKIVIPAEKLGSAGQITPLWRSNGGYVLHFEEKEYWHLCLEKGKDGIGYNAIVTLINKEAKGLVWNDKDNQGCDSRDLAYAVKEDG